ncbi:MULTISPECIES: hypothetical protein [Ferroplasma]|jgi:uncharacterized membrane protein|uniref:Copper resistance protein D domain-containing protein n=2 Tax=Ferroplasma TaxID=74968 RepID=S0AT86_FERAC|nr:MULTISPECIES: hypothetical protein [Ferroplasma]AGO61254.1 hypothetical protein FACI_IFERC00001G1274 [Ferroplasma acidarmanus Fer1]ARD84206.1 hypothetical protein FAD_0284 [Ferroplasma acidiphilum]NOL60069.1 DUF2269 domain-containing protein [Ferroplasma acidiphilum]WMT53113.1 MAG: DUF2269 domain-containing protein [Ferroplasma acidiphilum]
MYLDLVISQSEHNILFLILLSIHVLSAITFVGGSIFIWLILWPASYKMNDDKLRTRLLGFVGHRFAFWTNLTLGLLILTGLLMTYRYVLNPSLYFQSTGGELLFSAEILIIAMVIIMYGNNIYHGKLIVRLNEQGKLEEVKKIRKVTHIYSMITMVLLIIIVLLMVSITVYH